MSDSTEAPPKKRKFPTWMTCVALILAALAILYVINSTEPTAERESATLRRAMLVEVIEADQGTFRPKIVETGTVAPAEDILLAPQVGGKVVDIHKDFTPGGFIDAGEVILQIEAADYENLIAQRESELVEARTDLALEMGRQQIAERDFELLGERLGSGSNNLVLREPQLAASNTRVKAAEAALEQARLDLQRTQLRSPFNAQILTRMANLGSQVSMGMPVAKIVGIEQYWVMATLPPTKLPFINFPKGNETGATVELYKRGIGGKLLKRTGQLFRLIGELEANTRLARVVIQVEDPLCLEPASAGLPPLLVGEFLEVRIEGEPLENVVRLPLDYLRKGNTAWIMSEKNKLEVRALEIAFKDSEYAYVSSGISAGEKIVTSSLSRVTEGVDLRVEDDKPIATQ